MQASDPPTVRSRVASWTCPACRGSLEGEPPGALSCLVCHRRYRADAAWGGPDFLADAAPDTAAEQAECWDDEAGSDHVAAAAAVAEHDADDIFVKLPRLLRELDLEGKDYLDLGCGYGRTLLYAARRLGPASAAGVDVSAVMLGKARVYADQLGASVALARASIDALPLPAESVDVVYSSAVLLHLPTEMATRTMREAVRVLRPGGQAIFEDCLVGWLNPDGIQTKIVTTLGRRSLRTAWVRTYRRSEVEAMVRAAGPISSATIDVEGYRLLPKSLGGLQLTPLKPFIARVNERASRRLRFGSLLASGWSVTLHK